MYFALGKAYADIGLNDRSFDNLLAGNRLKRQRLGYDERGTLAMFDRIRAVFGADLAASLSGGGYPSAVPVFVIGMPRSGTTLVEQILAAHPEIFGAGEIQNLGRTVEAVLRQQNGVVGYPEALAGASSAQIREIGEAYVRQLEAIAPAARRVVNKLPANFFFVGLITAALPEARILHVRRDPIETCFSCFSRLFTNGQAHSYDLAELGRYYRAYAKLMEHWRTILQPGAMLEIDYEDLVEDFESQARRMIAHCGLDWSDACLEFHRAERVVSTASANQVRQRIYRSSLKRAHRHLDRLGPLIEALEIAPAGEE